MITEILRRRDELSANRTKAKKPIEDRGHLVCGSLRDGEEAAPPYIAAATATLSEIERHTGCCATKSVSHETEADGKLARCRR